MLEKQKISVRQLVEFIMRRGDLNENKNSSHTAQEGARLHRKIQKEAPAGYQKEVALKLTIDMDDVPLEIEGRADGIFERDNQIVIDEIKTSEPAFEDLEQATIDLYFYQAMVYAYIYSLQNDLKEIVVQLTYFQTTEKITTRQERHYSFEELEQFFGELTSEYRKWIIFAVEWRARRNTSLRKLTFPYPEYRNGQRELAKAVYKTIVAERNLFVEAPTGVGKTISTLFPSLKAVGEAAGERIFYLTAKTITRTVAEEALDLVAEQEADIRSITITAKDKICFLNDRNCTPEHCPFAKGYYDRVNDGIWDIIHHEKQITRSVIEAYAKKHTLCPFEFSLDVSLWCDVIIGDYNYLFDPVVYLRRFFENPKKENIFLVDEVHNLVSRSKEMYSTEISFNSQENVTKILGKTHRKLHRAFTKVENEYHKIQDIAEEDGWEFHHQREPLESMFRQMFLLSEKIKEWLAENPDDAAQEAVLNYYFQVLRFVRISEFYDDHYETLVTVKRDITIKLFCIDPSMFLEETLDKGKASILFSASLSPINYYQKLLGGGEESLSYQLPSPFDPNHQLLLIDRTIDTTYRHRQNSIKNIAEAIDALVRNKTGNYLVFFSSYHYLDDVVAYFQANYDYRTLIQDTNMNEEEREAFLNEFKTDPKETLIGFCVLGGIFSEGIDLRGTRLIGSVIVGVGLPQINHEQERIKEYYDEQEHQGFAYAYQLPGLNKVLQAAGRVIRGEQDQGVVLLLDQRFNTPRYRNLFPQHWGNHQIVRTEEIAEKTVRFWQKKSDTEQP